jgi:hypothetical protein
VNRVEINGRPATADLLAALAFAGSGHFTSMRLRDHRVRGLELHLQRLARDSRELFGREVDREQQTKLAELRAVLAQQPDADEEAVDLLELLPLLTPDRGIWPAQPCLSVDGLALQSGCITGGPVQGGSYRPPAVRLLLTRPGHRDRPRTF